MEEQRLFSVIERDTEGEHRLGENMAYMMGEVRRKFDTDRIDFAMANPEYGIVVQINEPRGEGLLQLAPKGELNEYKVKKPGRTQISILEEDNLSKLAVFEVKVYDYNTGELGVDYRIRTDISVEIAENLIVDTFRKSLNEAKKITNY